MRILFLLFVYSLYGCKNTQKEISNQPVQPGFSWFELSYRGGWEGKLSFCVDSNKIFFFPSLMNVIDGETVKYGILPDSIYQNIDSLIKKLKSIPSLDPDITYCDDCPEVSIKTIVNNDTTRVFQAGEIDHHTWKLIEQLEAFKKTCVTGTFTTVNFYMETIKDVSPPLPPKIYQ